MKLVKSIPTSEKFLSLSQKGLKQLLQRNDLGFFRLPSRRELWLESEKWGKQINQHYDDLVIVGIGGSSLGPRVIDEIFQIPHGTKKIHFCDNVDELEFSRLLTQIRNWRKTAFLLISKSGSTIETLVSTDFLNQHFKKIQIDFSQQVFVISELKSSPLVDWARERQRPVIEIPLDVGGRFSVLSPVGLVPAGFIGVNLELMRQGAEHALRDQELLTQVIAQSMMSFERKEGITLFWFYSSWMKNFAAWLIQLWAESLGKKTDRQGRPAPAVSTPMTAIGSCDQHSILQQVMEGARDKFVIFVRANSCETGSEALKNSLFQHISFFEGKTMGQLLAAEAQATDQALSQVGVTTMTLQIKDLSAYSVGYLFMFWELVVGGLGEVLDINAFDQPGVELGKSLAKQILKT